MGLLEDIKTLNQKIKQNNLESAKAQARKEQAESVFVAELEEINKVFGTNFVYDGTNLKSIVQELKALKAKEEAKVSAVVEKNTKVLEAISNGDYATAKKLLGVSDEELVQEEPLDEPTKGEVSDELVFDDSPTTSVEETSTQEPTKEDFDKDDLDDLEEDDDFLDDANFLEDDNEVVEELKPQPEEDIDFDDVDETQTPTPTVEELDAEEWDW